MSVFDPVYCVEADLRDVYPNIAKYDKKRVISGFTADSSLTGRYKCGSTGTISMLYRNGQELGTAQSQASDVTADDEWYYNEDDNLLYYYYGSHPNGEDIEAGYDWDTLVDDTIKRVSDQVRSIIGKPIFKHRFRDNNYDAYVVESTAGLACARLIRPHNRDLANDIERRYNYDGNEIDSEKGILQKLRDGDLSLTSEISPALGKGILVENSLDSSTTGGIDDIIGDAPINDTLEISIGKGGTFSYGTANTTVTYIVKGKGADGIMTNTLVSADYINGDYQTLCNGMYLRFVPGVYVADDSWYVKISAEEIETHQPVQSVKARAVW